LSGRLRPKPSWIDRIGTLLGASWIAAWLTGYILFLLHFP